MVSSRAVGAGLLAFPVAVVVAVVTNPASVLLAGLVPGIVTGALAPPGGRSGFVHGLLVGVLCTALFCVLLVGWVTLYPPERASPGFGLSLVVLALYGVVAGAESAVTGLATGLARR